MASRSACGLVRPVTCWNVPVVPVNAPTWRRWSSRRCAGLSARGADAAAAAEAFESAVRGGDHAAACFLLAPQTRSELMESRGAGCAAALGEARLPAPGARRGVQVYGRQAMVTFEADTLFLSQFPGSWRVVAAGCVPEPGEPYNCRVKGV